MKRSASLPVVFVFLLILIPSILSAQDSPSSRESFNAGWKFIRFFNASTDAATFDKEPAGLQMPEVSDQSWRTLDLPHDWAIEGPFSDTLENNTGLLPWKGIGWYRKHFRLDENDKGKRIYVDFDGAMAYSEVWLNGKFVGGWPYGYTSFRLDLTPYAEFGKENIIAVRLDTKKWDSRWYPGAGIYRNVWLVKTSQVHISYNGVFCTTPEIKKESAIVSVAAEVESHKTLPVDVTIKASVFKIDRNGKSSQIPAAESIAATAGLQASSSHIFRLDIPVKEPALWNLDDPQLYKAVVTVAIGNEVTDVYETNFGFRTLDFTARDGFFLNGKKVPVQGVCNHHDLGALGAAFNTRAAERQLEILKEMGCNAIRTSHNPFSTDFLDLCDAKGFLVIDEAFDEWELPKKKWLSGWNVGNPGKEGYATYFREWAKRDLRDFIMRDRNHPCVIMWSIGNEIDYPNDPYSHPVLNTEANPQTWAKYSEALPHAERLGEIARELVGLIKELDTSRPVTAGLASALMSNETGYADALDVAGYNYQEFRYAQDHLKYPKRPLYGSENGMTLEMWNYVADNDYVMGQFLWTGFEYIGEAGRYPSRSNTAGVIDLAGNRKPEFYFRQSLWSDKPMVFIGASDRSVKSGPDNLWSHKRVEPHWNWETGKTISVNAFTNCGEVELFLNGRSLGNKKRTDFVNRVISWDVPYEKGTLKAIAKNNGVEAASFEIKSSGAPAAIRAFCNEKSLMADNIDITHVFAEIIDLEGNIVYSATNEISCEIEGPARLLGMEDSNPSNTENYKDDKQHAFHGRLLIYLQALDKTGTVKIRLTSPGLKECNLVIPVVEQ